MTNRNKWDSISTTKIFELFKEQVGSYDKFKYRLNNSNTTPVNIREMFGKIIAYSIEYDSNEFFKKSINWSNMETFVSIYRVV